MNESERRDFEAGLSDEVDGWLRGDDSRRSFLTRMMLMGGAAMLPGLGWTASGSRAWGEGANLGEGGAGGPAAAVGAGKGAGVKGFTGGATDGSGYRAVQAAQKIKGKNVTLNLTYEAGLQALEPK